MATAPSRPGLGSQALLHPEEPNAMKNTPQNNAKSIAASALYISARATFCLKIAALTLAVAGCSALPGPPARPVLYDLGPGAVAVAPALPMAPPLALADVRATGLPEGASAVLYRLAYAGTQQLRPYSLARWSQPPAQLVQQRLREALGQRRAILQADEAAALDRTSAHGGKLPAVLRIELEEFSQLFTSPTQSTGTLRLRATLVDMTAAGDVLLGQRVFTVQAPAPTPDAEGGVAALADASDQVAHALAQWVEQLGR